MLTIFDEEYAMCIMCIFTALRSASKINGDALEKAANAADVQEVRQRVEGARDARQEEHLDLGPQGQPHLLQNS